MKVRCLRLADALDRPTAQSPWLTVGKIYHVLSVVLDSHARWWLRLIADGDTDVGLFRLELFEVVTASIPPAWVALWSEANTFELAPPAWLIPGFWTRYFDRDKAAKHDFEREVKAIIDSDP